MPFGQFGWFDPPLKISPYAYDDNVHFRVSQAWVVGGFVLTGAPWWLRDFRHLSLALGAPTVLFLLYYWWYSDHRQVVDKNIVRRQKLQVRCFRNMNPK